MKAAVIYEYGVSAAIVLSNTRNDESHIFVVDFYSLYSPSENVCYIKTHDASTGTMTNIYADRSGLTYTQAAACAEGIRTVCTELGN